MKKGRKNIILAVIFSLAIHIATGITLFHILSAKVALSESINKLNLVWVALETKNNKCVAARNAPLYPQGSLRHPEKEIVTGVRPESGNFNREVVQTAAPVFAAEIDTAKPSAKAAQEQVANSPGGATGDAAGSPVAQADTSDPQYLKNDPPVYPPLAKMRGYEGVVLIAMEILPGGNVGNLHIKRSSGYAILDQAAIEAVKNWKFAPAKKMGKPYAIRRSQIIKFFLKDDDNSQS